jgi:pyruvate,water dikinase
MDTVIGLEAITREDVEIAGGKGANLGELIKVGFPVPPGFVVTAQAYREFLDALSNEELGQSEIRDVILKTPLPEHVDRALADHHRRLKPEFKRQFVYAVRSSATAEDLGDASFAGQHDTYYYVTECDLGDMVRQCWASL